MTQLYSGQLPFNLGGAAGQPQQQQGGQPMMGMPSAYAMQGMPYGAGASGFGLGGMPMGMGLPMGGSQGLMQSDPALAAAMAGNVMFAGGGYATKPTLAVVGEGDAPEYVIPTDPQYRGRAKKLLKQAGKAIGKKGPSGVPQMAMGGPIFPSQSPQTLGQIGAMGHGFESQGPQAAPSQNAWATNLPGGMGAGRLMDPSHFYNTPTPQIGGYQRAAAGLGGFPQQQQNVMQQAMQRNMAMRNSPNAASMTNGFNQSFYPQTGKYGVAGLPDTSGPGWWSGAETPGWQGRMQQSLGTYGWSPANMPGLGQQEVPHMAPGGLIGGGGLLGRPGLNMMQKMALNQIMQRQMLGGPGGGYNMMYPGYGANLFGGQQPQMNANMLSAFLPQLQGGGGQGRGGGVAMNYGDQQTAGMADYIKQMANATPAEGGSPERGFGGLFRGDAPDPDMGGVAIDPGVMDQFVNQGGTGMAQGGVIGHYAMGGPIGMVGGMGGNIPHPAAPPGAPGAVGSFNLGGPAAFPPMGGGTFAPPTPNPGAAVSQGTPGTAGPIHQGVSGQGPIPVPSLGGGLTFPQQGGAGAALAGAGSAIGGPVGAALGAVGSAYGQSYNDYLKTAQQQYNNILGGYQGLMGNYGQGANQIAGGYAALPGQVLGMLGIGQGGAVGPGGQVQQGGNWGVAGPAAQAIADVYAQQKGAADQGTIDRGLGNTTVLNSVERGPALDAAKAYAALGSNLAQTGAGYMSQLGLAGLGNQSQALQNLTGLGQNQLGWENSVTAQPPNPADYSNIAAQAGQASLAQQGMNQAAQQFAAQLGLQGQALGLQGQQGAAQNQLQALQTLLGARQGQGLGGLRPPSLPISAGVGGGGGGQGAAIPGGNMWQPGNGPDPFGGQGVPIGNLDPFAGGVNVGGLLANQNALNAQGGFGNLDDFIAAMGGQAAPVGAGIGGGGAWGGGGGIQIPDWLQQFFTG